MANILVNDDESLDKAISRFRRIVEKEGIVREYKKRQYFQSPSALKHEQEKAKQRKELNNLRKSKKNKDY
ncbi:MULTISPECIES: 30S ribosomal protein S21 [unclassified Oceanispirochaeta]|uniref:30S ribosomal protein S21 n=1 Tax=unclassified Oceanispirochaeta TaxID=2635722 RepID=UPI000E09D77F|nr:MULTISPECIES: 30S ribosomal protein S21 [unclassified Oceanispirochaeta]MBF9017332.1 30S ribosomal protein S21 [Oceanispirochaeta sp. M2]NPD73707.1 30S ribosomal protein S21 [Oceanispirochaeta sp. M1]RDG30462.1 30S ribosomal protein S21 [Oceanispirochaeta sp. M1]